MRTIRRCAILLSLLFAGVHAYAQVVPVHEQDATDTIERKAAFKMIFNFDARRTFVNGDPVGFYGFRLGAQRGMDILSIGFYGLSQPYVRHSVDLDDIGTKDLTTEFDYVGFGYERLLLDVRRWQIGVPVSIGLGNYRTSYRDSADVTRSYSSNELVPLEATVQVDYNLFWWAFIGVGGGYRYVLAADRDVTRSLSDWTYFFKVGLRFGEVVRRARKELRKDHDA